MEEQKTRFVNATSDYFALLSTLDVRLRRQILALEEARILPSEISSKEIQADLLLPLRTPGARNVLNTPTLRHTSTATITGGELGSLDIGWLNSRNDHVGKEKQADSWEDARRFVEMIEGKQVCRDQGTEISHYSDKVRRTE